MTGRDKLSLIRQRWASRHGVGAPARVVAEESEQDDGIAPGVDVEAFEDEPLRRTPRMAFHPEEYVPGVMAEPGD